MNDLRQVLNDINYPEFYVWLTRFMRWYVFVTLIVGAVVMVLKRPKTPVQWASLALVIGFLCIVTQAIILYAFGIMINETLTGVFVSLAGAVGCTLFLIVCLREMGILARDGYRVWRGKRR